jgi:hypothetical protein
MPARSRTEAIRLALATPPPERGNRLIRMRYAHTEYFVGREDKLNEIHEKLWTSPKATLTQGEVQIVTALGGVGKTTLARAYADRFWRRPPWVPARFWWKPAAKLERAWNAHHLVRCAPAGATSSRTIQSTR